MEFITRVKQTSLVRFKPGASYQSSEIRKGLWLVDTNLMIQYEIMSARLRPLPHSPLGHYSPPVPSRLFQPRTDPSSEACSQEAAGERDKLVRGKICLLRLRVLQLSFRSQHNTFNNQRFVLLEADSHKVKARLTTCPCSQNPRQFAASITNLFCRLMSRL